jgi:hypothetical protein
MIWECRFLQTQIRLIFQQKYGNTLTELIKNKILLETIDNEQLEKAIENDTYALINQNEILKKADEFRAIAMCNDLSDP